MIRLYVVEDYPNTYVVDKDGVNRPLKVPSDVFKIIAGGNRSTIDPDALNTILLDMDVSHALKEVSGPAYIMRPVVKLSVETTASGNCAKHP